MARITKDWRQMVQSKVMAHTFKNEEEAMRKEAHEVFDKVADIMLGKHKDAVAKMPLDWFQTAVRFEVRLKHGNSYDDIMIHGAHARPSTLPRWGAGNNQLKDFPEALKIATEFAEKRWALEERRKAFEEKVRTVLASVTTTKRLYEIWPELHEIVPQPKDDRAVAHTHQLSTYVHELNKIIPLPTPKPATKATKKTTKKVARRA